MNFFCGFRKGFLAILLAGIAVGAHAEETHLIINGLSHHVDSSYEWNERHFGLGMERELGSSSTWPKAFSLNAFRDSNDEMSYMVGASLHRQLFSTERFDQFRISAGLTAFFMTRSDVNGNKPFPGVLPSVTLRNRDFGFNLTYLPIKAVEQMTNSHAMDPTLDGILYLQFRVSLDRLVDGFSPGVRSR